jgi:hypothetical protein
MARSSGMQRWQEDLVRARLSYRGGWRTNESICKQFADARLGQGGREPVMLGAVLKVVFRSACRWPRAWHASILALQEV